MSNEPDCPACGQLLQPRGKRLFCDGCAGVMVSKDELGEMLRYIYPDDARPLQQQLRPMQSGERACPQCRARMDAFGLNGVPIDQCFTHGFWFDRDELEKALQGTNTPESFGESHDRRQAIADAYLGGWAAGMIGLALRRMRRRKREQA